MIIRYCKVGSDISSNWFDVYLKLAKLEHQKRFSNDAAGFQLFLSWLLSLGIQKVHVCMEHTGCYETAFALTLHAAGHRVSIVDGAQASQYAKSLKGKSKSDKKDARVLHRFLRERKPELWSPRPDEYRLLTEFTRQREDFLKDLIVWQNRLAAPGYSAACKERARTMVTVLQMQLQSLEKETQEHIDAFPALKRDRDLITTIPGFGPLSAAKVLGEMGPVRHYSCAKDLAKSAGLTPIEESSGTRGRMHLPVYGNSRLRTSLYFCAMVAKRSDPSTSKWAHKIASNGPKSNKTVLVALMRKQCHSIFGVLTHRTPYDENILYAKLLKEGKANPFSEQKE